MIDPKFRSIRAFVALIALPLTVASCSIFEGRVPVGQWEALFEPDRDLSAVSNRPGWKPIAIPGTFKLPADYGDRGDAQGVAHVWLRGKVFIEGDPAELYGITMGRVFDLDSVYVNQYPVGEMGDSEIGLIRQRRNYIMPRGVLRQGENIVHVKLGVFSNERAGISSAVWLLPRRDYEMVNLITSFMYLHLPIEMMVVAGLISVVLLIFFIMNKREKLYLFTFMAVLLYMLFLVSLFFPFKNIDHSLSRFIQFASYHLFAIALLMIIQAFYSAYVPLYNRICVPFFLVLTGIVFVFRESPALIYIGNALALVTEAALIAVIAVMIPRFHRSRKDTFKLIMVSAVSIAGIGIALLEIAFSLAGGAYSLLVTAYSSPLFFLTFVIIFSRELMKKNMELDFLYARLKSQAAEGEGLSINEASRVKLDRVIAFIRENYTSDISREGLAAAVDMNPNYMSGLFKSYTGIRISDYIHQLRVDDAMARLADPEVKIIDVALTVGFESLSTFNRAFKKFAGVTPSEYRESLNT